MIPLLVLTALLLVLSGAFKLRAASRGEVGLHLLSIVELLAGVGLMFRMTAPPVPVGQGMAAAVGAVVLIVVSSLHLGRQLARKRRLRDLTEGRRLENYLRIQASMPDDPGAGGTGGIQSNPPG